MGKKSSDKENQINIELKEELAMGKYSNLAIVTHSFSEFIVDFVSVLPNMPHAPVVSRIILAPEHAKALLGALHSNIEKYEASYGEIPDINEQVNTGLPINYAGPTAEA